MSRRGKIIITLLGCGMIVALLLRPAPEPVYNGQSLSEWVWSYHGGWGPLETRPKSAAQAIQQIGSNAIPHLLEWIQFDYSPTKQQLRGTIGSWKSRLASFLNIQQAWSRGFQDVQLAESAPEAFGLLREHGTLAVPGLTRILNDPRHPWAANNAAEALARIGGPALPVLTTALQGTNAEIRGLVLKHISRLGPNAAPLAPLLAHILRHDIISNAAMAGRALAELKPDPDTVIPELIATLSSKDNNRIRISAYVLGCYGPRSRSAIPALTNLLNTTDQENKGTVIYVLHGIDPLTFTNMLPFILGNP